MNVLGKQNNCFFKHNINDFYYSCTNCNKAFCHKAQLQKHLPICEGTNNEVAKMMTEQVKIVKVNKINKITKGG